QARFGTADPVGEFSRMRSKIDSLDFVVNQKMGYTAGQHFMQMHDEFPQDERAVEALQARVAGLIRADKFGADISDTLEMAYSQLVAEGVITPVRDETPAFNPGLFGSSGNTSHVEAEQLSDEDLKRLLISHGMLSR